MCILEDRLIVRVALSMTGEEVVLSHDTVEDVIRQRVGETTHFRDYQAVRYALARGITNDFDF